MMKFVVTAILVMGSYLLITKQNEDIKVNMNLNVYDCQEEYAGLKKIEPIYQNLPYRQYLYYDTTFLKYKERYSKNLDCLFSIIIDSTKSKNIKSIAASFVLCNESYNKILNFCNQYIDSLNCNYDRTILIQLLLNQDDHYYFPKKYSSHEVVNLYNKLLAKKILRKEDEDLIIEVLNGKEKEFLNAELE